MSVAKIGDTVHVHYTGSLSDGTVFDSSEGRTPLSFSLGDGGIIAGFEQAVLGMQPGDSKTVEIIASEAYGDRVDDLVIKVPRGQFPPDITPEVGQNLIVGQPDGSEMPVLITEVSLESVTLDANHPLAGKDLTFQIELVAIEE
ncbi:MAG: peptidylprolyl isomerase [Rhodothermales bacterium]